MLLIMPLLQRAPCLLQRGDVACVPVFLCAQDVTTSLAPCTSSLKASAVCSSPRRRWVCSAQLCFCHQVRHTHTLSFTHTLVHAYTFAHTHNTHTLSFTHTHTRTHTLIHTLAHMPFKSLGSLRNVLIFERKALFFSMKITLN